MALYFFLFQKSRDQSCLTDTLFKQLIEVRLILTNIELTCC